MQHDILESQFQLETQRDQSDYFHVEKYVSTGYYAHFHRNVEIFCIFSGSAQVFIDDKEYELTAGDAVFVSSWQIHSYTCEKGTEVGFALLGSLYMKTFYDIYPNRYPPVLLNDKEKNKGLFDYITFLSNKNNTFSPFERFSYTNMLLHLITSEYGVRVRSVPGKKKGFNAMPQIIQYIYDNYSQPLTLSSIAEQFHYAPLSLSRLFGRYIRIDIRNFINNVRIQHVIALKNLPENNEKSIIDLAFQCGFNSVSSFYRAYNKLSYSVSSTSESIDEGSM